MSLKPKTNGELKYNNMSNDEEKKFLDKENHNEEIQNEKSKINKPKALDGGWGWMVAIGIYINFLLIQFLGPSFGILFHDLLVSLEVSSSGIHWVFAMQMFLWHIMVLVNGSFIKEFGWRFVAMTGSLLLCIAFITSAFATSGLYLFFSYSLLTGVGGSMIMTSSFYILPIYWDKRRGLATAIAMAGVCTGRFVTPILIHYLLESLGFMGCCLVIGAIVLNGVPASSVFHPIEWHLEKPTEIQEKPCDNLDKPNAESKCKRIKEFFLRIINTTFSHMKVLKTPQALLIALSSSLAFVSLFNFQMNIPYAMVKNGFQIVDAAYGKTILSSTSAVGRISSAFLSDFSWFKKPIGFLVGIIFVMTSIIGFPFSTTLPTIYCDLAFHGLGMGLLMSLYSLVIIDFMGLEKYPATFGSACLFTAFSSITVGPLSGHLKDKTNDYNGSIWLLGSFEALSLLLWIFLIIKYQIKQK